MEATLEAGRVVPALSGPAVSRTELPEENTDPRPLGGRLCRDLSPLETGIMRNCQASSQRGPGLGLCARGGPAVPASLLRGLCQASSPSSFTLHGGFVKGTIRHSEETTQLPPSLPENKTAPLCANDPPLPGRLPAKGKWRGGRAPLCGNPGDGVLMSCPQLQAEHAVPEMLLPPCGKGLSLGF